jgi:hypothetical protein
MTERYLVINDEIFVPFDGLRVIEVPNDTVPEDIEEYIERSRYFDIEGDDDAVATNGESTWREAGYRTICRQDSLDDFIEGILEVEADDAVVAEWAEKAGWTVPIEPVADGLDESSEYVEAGDADPDELPHLWR